MSNHQEPVAAGASAADGRPPGATPIEVARLSPHAAPLGLLGDPLFQNGTLVGDRYRIESVLGRGGFGDVYRAVHVGTHEAVALKVLRPELLSEGTAAERFAHEARLSASLRHPNTVRVFDFGRTPEGALYLAMEFLDGESLETLVQREAPLPPARALRLVVQVLRSLAEAHSKHIVHRDLKPDNIFVGSLAGEPDFVRVIDFGIAKLVAEGGAVGVTQIGAILGTPHYMSPEQIRGEPLDARADLYSVGVVLYRCLCGRHPFNGESTFAILAAHLQDPLASMAQDGVDGVLERIVARALARDRSDRFDSADAFRRALEAWQPPVAEADDRTVVCDVIVVPEDGRAPLAAVGRGGDGPAADGEATRLDNIIVVENGHGGGPEGGSGRAVPATAVIAHAAASPRGPSSIVRGPADSHRVKGAGPAPARPGAATGAALRQPSAPRPVGRAVASDSNPTALRARQGPARGPAASFPGASDEATVAMDILSADVHAAATQPQAARAAVPSPRRNWLPVLAGAGLVVIAAAVALAWSVRAERSAAGSVEAKQPAGDADAASPSAAAAARTAVPPTSVAAAPPPAQVMAPAAVPSARELHVAAPVAATASSAPASAPPPAAPSTPPAESARPTAPPQPAVAPAVVAHKRETLPAVAAAATAAAPTIAKPVASAPAPSTPAEPSDAKAAKTAKASCSAPEGSREWCASCPAAKELSSSSRWFCPCLEARGQTSGLAYYCKCEFPKQSHKIGSPAFCRCNPRDPSCQGE